MKSIIINIEDDIYQNLKMYSSENGEDVVTIAKKCFVAGFLLIKSDSESPSGDIEAWKKERSFGRYGRRKILSHTLC